MEKISLDLSNIIKRKYENYFLMDLQNLIVQTIAINMDDQNIGLTVVTSTRACAFADRCPT